MFCGQCGSQNADDARFCANCGEVLNSSPIAEPENAPIAPPKKSKNLLYIISGAVLAVALVLLLIFGIRTPKSVAKKALKGFENGNAKSIVKVLPKSIFEDTAERKEFQEELQEGLDDLQTALDRYNASITFQITGVEKCDADDLADCQDTYEYFFDLKVKAAKEVSVKMTITEDGDREIENFSLYVIKVGGKWYVDIFSLEELLREFV